MEHEYTDSDVTRCACCSAVLYTIQLDSYGYVVCNSCLNRKDPV